MVCVMRSKGTVAEVVDGGGQIIGQEACSDFVSSGWGEDTTAEQRVQRQEQQQADAQASASASASQAQAQQEQRDQDQQTAQSDLSTLRQDASYTGVLSGDLSSFASDIQTARSDLATEKQDSAGDNSYCGAVETAAGDAESVNGDLESVQGDAESMSPDISAVRQDITSLTSDLRILVVVFGTVRPGEQGKPAKGAQPRQVGESQGHEYRQCPTEKPARSHMAVPDRPSSGANHQFKRP